MVFKSKKSVFNVGATLAEFYEREPSRPPNVPPAVPSIVTADMIVNGDLQSPGDMQVEGRVIGQIRVNRLVLAEGAAITGDIIAKEVRICGTLHGTVRSSLVTLTETGRVIGDIFHDLLSIETGGQLEGRCHRLDSAAAPEPPQDIPAAADPAATEPDAEIQGKPVEAMPRIYANGRSRNAAA